VKVKVGCVRVGVVGLVTQGYGADDQPSREPYCGVFRQDPRYAQELARQVKAHRAEVDVMIALTHTGIGEDIALAQGVSGVDLVVGAHTEDLLKAPQLAQRADGTRGWVLQAGHYGQTLGRADLVFDPRTRTVSFEGYRIVDVDASLPHDDTVAELAASLEREAEPDLHAVIASVRDDRKAGREMSDLLFKAVARAWGADALVVGRDVFWEGLPKGPLTLDRLYRSVLVQREPSGTSGFTSLYLVDVKGDALLGLRARAGLMYDVFVPPQVDVKRTYRVAMEKRAYTYPFLAWAGGASVPPGRFAGEIIDVLERHARTRAAEGLSID
jgi:2',3'-cyclic-nucleotide 2'-phosphodiesterase (5'-nucleotidase family)